jgi:U3 small nucleolar RNA-associated protein 10
LFLAFKKRSSVRVQVLLVSRSESAGARLAAIECVFNIVTRLREEYLGLLPESLPFLAELLEDSDTAVLARCKDLVKLLEELSDENLEGYLKM